jgi:hypothetical protein
MQKQRRNGRASTKTSVEDEIAHLRGLVLKGLRSRWQSVFRRPAPAHLTADAPPDQTGASQKTDWSCSPQEGITTPP